MIFGQEDISLIYTTYEKKDNVDEMIKPMKATKKCLLISKAKESEVGVDMKTLNESMGFTPFKADALLAIVEMGNNYVKHEVFYLPKSRVFWLVAMKHKAFRRAFRDLSEYQLRQIWLILSDMSQRKLIDFIKDNRDVISMSSLNLFVIVKRIANFFKEQEENGAGFQLKASMEKFKDDLNYNSLYHRNLKNTSSTELYSKFFTNHKELINKTQKKSTINKPNNENDSNDNFNGYPQHRNSLVLPNEAHRREFKDIDEIVRILKEAFPHHSIHQILHILHLNSFSIEQSYNYLKHHTTITLFSDADDYIISHMQSTDLYTELVKEKGESAVNQRKRYLNIA